jgi:predicted dehydrogenase/threonine dehydrogenase-like Zn-dependent dehydrogenase
MKQVIQNLRSGATVLEEVPAPQVRRGHILIQSTRTLVSLGTERMLVEFGKASLISKARQQPDKVKMVLDKIRAEGLMPTLEAVFNKLDQPIPLGYCHVGKVIEIGEGVIDFKIGDRVASNGEHAEIVCVPVNLAAKIPDNVSDEAACFTVIGSIGLQGIRLLNPTLGETVVVVGLGLIGLITAELLLANGCQVIGIDLDPAKVALARQKGVLAINPADGIDPVKYALEVTRGIGVDGVLITASSKSNDIIAQAAQMSRKRGRIILVGVIGLDIKRADFYEKELSFQVSCSYGPGRYDDNYEARGNDYPIAFVRWTEKRNFEAILQALSTQRLQVESYITELVPLSDFGKIYDEIGTSRAIASILKYDEVVSRTRRVVLDTKSFAQKKGVVGVVGAGNYTKGVILPMLKGENIKSIASAGGVSGTLLAKKFGIAQSTTDYQELLTDTEVDTVFITTRHDLHARMCTDALKHNKHVFVEKPLALDSQELETVLEAYKNSQGSLTVGFNRRFSPHIQQIKKHLSANSPKNIVATMNAGFIPNNVWVHDLKVGGGRIIGEACHYLDLVMFLSGSPIKAVCMSAMGENPQTNTDNASILVKFENGDNAVVNYFANGNKAYSKERVEVFSEEKTFIMDNFRRTEAFGVKGFSTVKTSIDKGHEAQFKAYMQSIKSGGAPLIPFNELVNGAKATFAALESLRSGGWVQL